MSNLNNNKQNNIKRKALKRMNNHPINNKPDTLVMKVKDDEKNVYWFQDLGILTDIDRLTEVLPDRSMSYSEKINSLVRLSWYVGLLLAIVNTNYLYLYIPIVTMFITFILYSFRKENFENVVQHPDLTPGEKEQIIKNIDAEIERKFKNYEVDENGDCVNPNIENPFMNAMPYDDRSRKPACNVQTNPLKRTEVDVLYDQGTYRDANNVFDRNTGKRQFFTMPWTTYPNDQGGFANWLYKRPPTCKEGNGAQCVANQYTPLSRHNLITPARGSTPS